MDCCSTRFDSYGGWKAKISLCYWQFKLGWERLNWQQQDITSNVPAFPPGTKIDHDDYEGGLPDNVEIPPRVNPTAAPPLRSPTPLNLIPVGNAANMIRIRLPAPSQLPTASKSVNLTVDEQSVPLEPCPTIQGHGFVLRLMPAAETPAPSTDPAEKSSNDEDDGSEAEARGRHTFCPVLYQETVLNMMERHYCAHPIIPGYAAPDAIAIKRWAVKQMYQFCVQYELPELWAYLWENWYQKGWWELWARSVHEMIPILKTT